MSTYVRRYAPPALILLAMLLGVFILPFFFATAHTASVSSSNDAGFSNKFASVWACACAGAVFGLALLRPKWFGISRAIPYDPRPLPRIFAFIVCAISLAGTAVVAAMVLIAHVRYQRDAGYFINQMSSFAIYHRSLWSQIEFPYGPFLFYPPILLQQVIGSQRIDLQTCYYICFVLEQAAGLGCLIYIVNRLPMTRNWRIGVFVFGAALTIQPLLGVNYTLLRFLSPLMMLLFSMRRKNAMTSALCLSAGVFLTLSVSVEMGFAFAAGASLYSFVQVIQQGKRWILCLIAIPIAAGLFLLSVGRPFLQMLELFAGGTFNLILTPTPYTLLFLFALIWLLPTTLADRVKSGSADAWTLGPLFVTSAALVPVAFGRADAPHILFNGLGLFLLSGIAASRLGPAKQLLWCACMIVSLDTGLHKILDLGRYQFKDAMREALQIEKDWPVARPFVSRMKETSAQRQASGPMVAKPVFRIEDLRKITGSDSVATPQEVDLQVETALQREGLYRPSFFYYMTAVLDRKAEERKINELNQARWSLIPENLDRMYEFQPEALTFLHHLLPHRVVPPPYIVGDLFDQNLQENWRPVASIAGYNVYKNIALTNTATSKQK